MKWLREAVSDSQTGLVTTKRIVMLVAAVSMSTAIIILALAAYVGRDVALALGAIAGPLAGMAGYGYVNGKVAESKRLKENQT